MGPKRHDKTARYCMYSIHEILNFLALYITGQHYQGAKSSLITLLLICDTYAVIVLSVYVGTAGLCIAIFPYRLMHTIKCLKEDHDNHPVCSRASQGPPLSKPIQETSQSREESFVLLPASSAYASYREEHHFCYLVTTIQETASQD